MSDRVEFGRGTVRTIRNRRGVVTGYQALMPRELSRPPAGCKNPDDYREPLGDPLPTYEEARGMLDAAILKSRSDPLLGRGPTFAWFVDAEIKARHTDARRELGSEVKANRAVATWRSIERTWFVDAPFNDWRPQQINAADLQAFVTELRDEGENQHGEPLSGGFIRNVVVLIRAALDRAGVRPNPARDLTLPDRSKPRVPHLKIGAQRQLFAAQTVDLRDRLMIGCGMGAGLRVGELLAIEVSDVFLDRADPHVVIQYGGPNHAPTKGRRVRTVELFEPGLGFWRRWMAEHYRPGDRLVFSGPRGGFQKAWPELFQGWAPAAGMAELTSHIMRHTYAVSLLSGSWGYAPRSLEFVSKQLGHSSVQVTEWYYGAFEAGVWRREVQLMTGRPDAEARVVVTAEELLGSSGGSVGTAPAQPTETASKSGAGVLPRYSPKLGLDAENKPRPSGQAGASPQASESDEEQQFDVALAERLGASPPPEPAARITAAGEEGDVADVG
jgi:integrase